MWLKYSLVISPKPAFESHSFSGVSETPPFSSLITNKNNSLQMLTLVSTVLCRQNPQISSFFSIHPSTTLKAGIRVLQSKEKASVEVFPVPLTARKNKRATGILSHLLYHLSTFSHHLSPSMTNFTTESIHVHLEQGQKTD